jgi:RNA recognition motif-containing protein
LTELLKVFKRFGPVNEKLSVVKDQNYAFIHFYSKEDANAALREINDSLFKDRYIRVQYSTSPGYTNASHQAKPDSLNVPTNLNKSKFNRSLIRLIKRKFHSIFSLFKKKDKQWTKK